MKENNPSNFHKSAQLQEVKGVVPRKFLIGVLAKFATMVVLVVPDFETQRRRERRKQSREYRSKLKKIIKRKIQKQRRKVEKVEKIAENEWNEKSGGKKTRM